MPKNPSLARLIAASGKTQRRLCAELGWYEEKMSRLMNGKIDLRVGDIKRLSEVLRVDDKEIFNALIGGEHG